MWASAPRQGGFTQRFPKDGAKASQDTQFALLYDEEAIYVGVWAHDLEPAKIRRTLTRRDADALADAVVIGIDSYHDKRTAYVFQINAAGVQRDMMLFDDNAQDDSWDAVWTGDVAMTSDGWTAEVRIPLNQLRFAGGGEAQEWGLQVLRLIARNQEQSTWSPWPRTGSQVVSRFGIIDGIQVSKPSRRLELLPYASGGVQRQPIEDGDPLNDHNSALGNVGLDLKYGLGPAFTLSATLNPDFGQVEADPSKINLSASELFFAEKRPFFLEGVDLFKLAIGNSDNSSEGAFYSRRIGAAPVTPDVDYDFIHAPQSTAIYGAAKLTGKTAGGWSVGVLDAVTGRETAEIATAGDSTTPPRKSELAVAPLTNYAIARIKRDLRDGATSVGVSATAVNRQLEGTGLESMLRDQAYTGGVQLQHRWADNAWTAKIALLGSWVHGSEEAIAAAQKSSVHYFQRPDASDVHLDPTRTSLSGLALTWMVGRLGDTKHWRFGAGGDLRTAGLELNDAGFQLSSDRVIPFFYGEYRDDSPSDHVLNWQLSSDLYWVQTLEPRLTVYGVESNANIQFGNYWSLSGYVNYEHNKWNLNALRGGRGLRFDPGIFGFFNLATDTRNPVWFSVNTSAGHNFTSGEIDGGVDLGATIQARSNIDVFVGPGIYLRNNPLQYVDQISDDLAADRTHFVFGRIHETDLSMTLRVNWTFSPHLALQAYAQPYIASGRYDELKDVDHPGAARYSERFHLLEDGLSLADDGTYRVARPDGTFSFDRSDFNFRQLRSTVVVRWEYRPGSTVFAIWSHGQTSDELDDGRFRVGRDVSDLVTARSENIVMIKANYWIGL